MEAQKVKSYIKSNPDLIKTFIMHFRETQKGNISDVDVSKFWASQKNHLIRGKTILVFREHLVV